MNRDHMVASLQTLCDAMQAHAQTPRNQSSASVRQQEREFRLQHPLRVPQRSLRNQRPKRLAELITTLADKLNQTKMVHVILFLAIPSDLRLCIIQVFLERRQIGESGQPSFW